MLTNIVSISAMGMGLGMNTCLLLSRDMARVITCAFFIAGLTASEPGIGAPFRQSKSAEYQPLGLRAGSFMFYPVLEMGVESDSNIFRVPSELEENDTIFHLDPSVYMTSDWSRHELNAYAWARLGYYDEFSNEDYEDYSVSADGRLDVLRDSYATGYVGFASRHEGRSSVDNRFGAEPTTFTQAVFGLGYDHTFNRLTVSAAYDYEALDYDDVPGIFEAVINNDDRDRKRNEGTLRVAYQVRPQFDFFVEGALNAVDYDNTPDDTGRERSSNGYRLNAGASIDITSVLVGDVFVGYLRQEYDDPGLRDIDNTDYGFRLFWYATALTTVTSSLQRSPTETTEPEASGYLSTALDLRVDHELRRNILLHTAFSYRNNDYEQSVPGRKENEDIFDFSIGGKYLFNRRFYARAEYAYERRNSDIEEQEFTANEFRFALGAQW